MNSVKKIIEKILSGFILVTLIYVNISFSAIFYDINHKTKIVNEKYYSNQSICKLFKCHSIIEQNKTELIFDNGELVHTKISSNRFLYITDRYSIDLNHLMLAYEVNNVKVLIPLSGYLDKILFSIMYSFPLLFILMIIIVRKIVLDERADSIVRLASTEALSTNQSMMAIAENIHHELNSPVEIINSKAMKIKRKLKKDEKLWKELEKDFDFIFDSVEQINGVLNRMRKFKTIKYSNGNKTIYNIIETSLDIMKMKHSMFEYEIDERFKKYSLEHNYMQNADLMNVLLNHIKNSMEASASKINIKMDYYNIKEKRIVLLIQDNGMGIPQKEIKNIFKPDFSTKQSKDELIRGNGMFLNKTIIEEADGKVDVYKTSEKGTTIRLSFHAVPFKEKEH